MQPSLLGVRFVAYATNVAIEVADATKEAASFEHRLASASDNLAPAERRVAEHLLAIGPEAALLTAAALAEQLGTSDATVVRTAKALGYSGLAELRQALLIDTANPTPGDRLRRTLDDWQGQDIFAATLHSHVAALDALVHDVSVDDFALAVQTLAERQRVLWRGVGPSAQLARYGQMLTERIGKASRALVETGTSFADELLTVSSDDALVVLAYGRVQRHVRVMLERAESAGAPVIVVTDTLTTALGTTPVVTLRSGRGTPGLFASHGTTVLVIEALVLGVAAADRATAANTLATLNELRADIAGQRIDVDRP
jgi:DNA-binding MurR/RpiR family transcriptional regulator